MEAFIYFQRNNSLLCAQFDKRFKLLQPNGLNFDLSSIYLCHKYLQKEKVNVFDFWGVIDTTKESMNLRILCSFGCG